MSEIDKIQLKDASGQLIAEYDLPGGSSSDTKVTQTETTTSAEYELLFSETAADATTHTEEARKSSKIIFNPSNQTLKIKSQYDDQTIIKSNSINVNGDKTASMYSGSIVHGFESKTESSHSYAGGYQTQAKGYASHAEGYRTLAGTGQGAHAEGDSTTASGSGSHAEGYNATASGTYSHAEGNYTTASGANAHAEGYQTTASGSGSHAEGNVSQAYGYGSHAEGYGSCAGVRSSSSKGAAAHAEGLGAIAKEDCSHAEGLWTYASSAMQHVQGKYNIEDANDVYAHIVGNGTEDNARSNAYALRWNGQQDVTNDIVRVDSGGTWDGFNASLEDAFKQNLGECWNYEEVEGTTTYYNFYEIAEIVVDPGTVEDNYEHQDDISNPIVMEISQIVSKNPGISDATGYSVLEIAFKFDLDTVRPEILQFLSSNSLDYFLLKDDNDSTIWHLYGRYRYITQSTPQTKNKSILHRITGSGFNNNITVVMRNVLDNQEIISILTNGVAATRNFVKTSTSKDFVRNSAIAANYDNTATYAVGDLCFYQSTVYSNALYVCNTAISTPEDFDSTHWTRVTLPEYFVKKSGDTMTGDFKCGNITIYAAGSNGNKNSILIGDDVTIGDCNNGGCFGMKSTGTNAGIRFFNSSGTTLGGIQSTNGTLQWIDTGGTSRNIAHAANVGTGDSNGQVKIAGTNVSVKGLADAAYRGVFSRSSTGDIGWGTTANRTKVLEESAIAFWNGCHSGTSSNLQYCDRGRFGTIVTKNTGDYLPINPASIEFTSNAWHFLDFHFEGSKDDFTARLIESSKGTMRLYYRILTNERVTIENQYGGIIMYHGTGSCVSQMRTGGTGVIEFLQTGGYGTWATCKAKAFSVQSSKWIKENINDLTEEEALKLLNLRPVTFDYTDGVTKNCRGLIAEEAYEELPYCVDMPEEYLNLDHDPILEADKDEDTDIGILPSIDYSKFVPHLIKLCQIQQKQIDELTERVSELESKLN